MRLALVSMLLMLSGCSMAGGRATDCGGTFTFDCKCKCNEEKVIELNKGII